MSTYTQIIYQIVFGTKNREKTLQKNMRDELFKYITGLLENKKCHLYRIGGVEDHIHIATHVHPSVALAALVKDIKLASTAYIKENNLFPRFRGWQEGYGAFTYSISAKENLISYIMNQEEHHRMRTFEDEYMALLHTHDVKFNKEYLL